MREYRITCGPKPAARAEPLPIDRNALPPRSAMTFQRLLVGLVDHCRRNALRVVLVGVFLAIFAGWYAAGHLGINTDTDQMFAASLPWRQRAELFKGYFPQFRDLLVAVIDAKEPEEADDTAAALAEKLEQDSEHFLSVRRPDALPFLRQEGMLFLDTPQLESLLDRTIDAQPFLGELALDPSARGVFKSLSLLGTGVVEGKADLAPYQKALTGFHQAMVDVIAGHPHPLSWTRLLGGDVADLAGPYKFVLVQPRLDLASIEPGGAATRAMREAAAGLEFIKSGDARMRITGSVALADEEFASVAQGAIAGLIGSILLISLWLFLAVHSWRLILPILLTLGLGLMLTLLFAAAAVGTLNLVSVGFGILFGGIAVDFAIQFCVRYRENRYRHPNPAAAMAETGRRVGGQILVAAAATSAGFLAFVPTDFRGVAELGLIAGVGMLIAFLCTMTFLPAAISLFRPHGESAEIGFRWAAPLATIGAVRVARHDGPRPAATAGLRCRPAPHQGPEHRSDADPVRPRGFAGDQSFHDRHPYPRCRRCSAVGGSGSGVAARLGSAFDQQLCAEGPAVEATPDRGCRHPSGPNADDARSGPASDPGRDPGSSADRAGKNRAGAGEAAARSRARGDRRRPAQAGGSSRSGPPRGRSVADPLLAIRTRPAAHGAAGATGLVADHSAHASP